MRSEDDQSGILHRRRGVVGFQGALAGDPLLEMPFPRTVQQCIARVPRQPADEVYLAKRRRIVVERLVIDVD